MESRLQTSRFSLNIMTGKPSYRITCRALVIIQPDWELSWAGLLKALTAYNQMICFRTSKFSFWWWYKMTVVIFSRIAYQHDMRQWSPHRKVENTCSWSESTIAVRPSVLSCVLTSLNNQNRICVPGINEVQPVLILVQFTKSSVFIAFSD